MYYNYIQAIDYYENLMANDLTEKICGVTALEKCSKAKPFYSGGVAYGKDTKDRYLVLTYTSNLGCNIENRFSNMKEVNEDIHERQNKPR